MFSSNQRYLPLQLHGTQISTQYMTNFNKKKTRMTEMVIYKMWDLECTLFSKPTVLNNI